MALAGSGTVQHRRRLQHALGRRPHPLRAVLGGRRRRDRGVHLLGPGQPRQPARQRAAGGRHRARRPRRADPAAAAGDGRRAPCDLQARRGGSATVLPVRPGRARVPPRRQWRQGRVRRSAVAAEPRAAGHAPAATRAGGGRGRRTRIVRHALRDPRRGRGAAPRDRGHEADRSGAPDLHERHDGPAQGRADAAFVPDRQSAGFHLFARRVPTAGRRVLVAGRLGLDRRPDGRAAAHAALRPADRRLSRPLRSGARVPPDRALPGAQHLPVPDRAQADDEGVAAAARALRRRAAQRDERRRGAAPPCSSGRARRSASR